MSLRHDLHSNPSLSTTYSIERRGGCVLVHGSIPISDFPKLTKLVPKKAVLDSRLADIAGCNMAFGLAEDCRALIADLVPIAIARALKTYAGSGLSSRAIEWLAIGQRGQSSNAMFYRFSGIRPANMSNTNSPTLAHPYDGSDLRRCRLLMEQVPDFAGRIAEMADVSPVWAAIVLAWDDLCKTMDIENPGWPAGTGSCFQTTDKLVEIARSSTIPERVASSE